MKNKITHFHNGHLTLIDDSVFVYLLFIPLNKRCQNKDFL